jgi:hypothetical protein
MKEMTPEEVDAWLRGWVNRDKALQSLLKDAERYRYLRNRNPPDVLLNGGEKAGVWIDCEIENTLTLLTGEDADKAIDAEIAKGFK